MVNFMLCIFYLTFLLKKMYHLYIPLAKDSKIIQEDLSHDSNKSFIQLSLLEAMFGGLVCYPDSLSSLLMTLRMKNSSGLYYTVSG